MATDNFNSASKTCIKCGEAHPIESFYKSNGAKGGRSGTCRYCSVAITLLWKASNPLKVKQYAKKNNALTRNVKKRGAALIEKSKTLPVHAMRERVRDLIRKGLKNGGYTKSQRTQEILGCTWDEFVAHMERQFLRGMSWEGRREWHIDHIVPLATARTEEEVVALSHFTNLRPLWAADNLAKNDSKTHLI